MLDRSSAAPTTALTRTTLLSGSTSTSSMWTQGQTSETAAEGQMYMLDVSPTSSVRGLSVVLRTGDPLAMTETVHGAMRQVDPTAHDPLTIGAAIALIAVVAALAGCLPARRAARVDPMEALRQQ